MKSARLSNIELLRIVAMVMILILHANGALGPFVAVDNTDTPTAPPNRTDLYSKRQCFRDDFRMVRH